MTLAEYLKAQRMTREAFAASLGVSVSAVTKWCRGERSPRPKMVTRIAEITNGALGPKELRPDFFAESA